MKETTPKQTYSRFGASYLIGYVVYVALVFIVSLIIHAISPQLFASGQARMIISFSILYIIGYPFMYMIIKNLTVYYLLKKRLGAGGFLASRCITYDMEE